MSCIVKIRPLDTLFFRTGRPFTMGIETWAEYLFPPSPSTIYGAIRSLMIFKREGLKAFEDGKYSKDIGTKDKKGSLKIIGPVLFKDEIFFPAPLDLVKEKHKNSNELFPLEFSKRPPLFFSNYTLDNILIYKPIKNVEQPEGWLSEIMISDYLQNKKNKFLTLKDESLFIEEPKIGIARDRQTLTSREAHLYRIPMIRLGKNVSLVVEIHNIEDFPESGVLQLGGESKGASFKKTNQDLFSKLNKIDFNFENQYFKIYLVTPAIFKNGWLPEWIDKNTFEGKYNDVKVKLVGCAIGKPLQIGGWDIVKKRSKPLQKVVPPGSVYYFKILNDSGSQKIKEAFHLQNISDINPEEGFGLSLVGEVNYEKSNNNGGNINL